MTLVNLLPVTYKKYNLGESTAKEEYLFTIMPSHLMEQKWKNIKTKQNSSLGLRNSWW